VSALDFQRIVREIRSKGTRESEGEIKQRRVERKGNIDRRE
jgi:hypothetical protein